MIKKPTYQELEQRVKALEERVAHYKHIEEDLKESEVRYRAIVEAFDGLIYICSEDYRIEFMNKKFIERIGYDGTGELCYKVIHDREFVVQIIFFSDPIILLPRLKQIKICPIGNHRHLLCRNIFLFDQLLHKGRC